MISKYLKLSNNSIQELIELTSKDIEDIKEAKHTKIHDRSFEKSKIINPVTGTVLTKYAEKYEIRFSANRTALLGGGAGTTPVTPTGPVALNQPTPKAIRVNNFPLLQENNNTRTLGSLVSLGAQQSPIRLITVDADDG